MNLDMYSDYLNPFLVKEIRQSLKQKFIHGIIIFTSLTCLIIMLIGLLINNQKNYDLTGRVLFFTIQGLLILIICFIFPIMGSIRFYNERHNKEYELYQITGIKSFSIINGKLQTIIIFSFIIIMISMPFILLCNFLQGISSLEIIFFMILIITFSIFNSMIGIFIGSLNINKILMVFINIIFGIILMTSYTSYLIYFPFYFKTLEIFKINSTSSKTILSIIILLMLYFPLLYILAKSSITSKLKNRTFLIRIFFLIITFTALFIFFTGKIFSKFTFLQLNHNLMIIIYSIISIPIIFAQFGLLAGVKYSPVSIRKYYKKNIINKILRIIFYPGKGSLRIWFSIVFIFFYLFELLNFDHAFVSNSIAQLMIISFAAALLNRFSKLIIKHKVKDITVAVFINILFLFSTFGMSKLFDSVPGLSSFIKYFFIPSIILLNTIYGIVLYYIQLKHEKKQII